MKSISYKGLPVFYKTTGEGQPVILLHGFAEDSDVWHYQTSHLKKSYRLIIPDIPGSGASPFNERTSTIDDYAEVVKEIIQHENIDQCVVIGHSMGGYIALALAEKYPQLLKAFGLFHSTAFPDTEEKKQVRLKAIEFIKANGGYTFIKSTASNLFAADFKKNYPEQIEALIEKGKQFTADALIQYYQAMIARPDRTTILKTTAATVLFIIGEFDGAVPLEDSLRQAHLPLQSHIHILSNSAHMGMWEETLKANKIVHDFLNMVC